MKMNTRILTEFATSITEFKINPMKAVSSGHGLPVAVLNRNAPAFYCIPADTYEQLMDRLEDLELLAIAKERENTPSVRISLDEL
jgi:antitoxin StbD